MKNKNKRENDELLLCVAVDVTTTMQTHTILHRILRDGRLFRRAAIIISSIFVARLLKHTDSEITVLVDL